MKAFVAVKIFVTKIIITIHCVDVKSKLLPIEGRELIINGHCLVKENGLGAEIIYNATRRVAMGSCAIVAHYQVIHRVVDKHGIVSKSTHE